MVRIRKAPQPDLVDLHVHSSASDGSLSPRDLVCHARAVGLKAIALTDHDTVAGVPEALAAAGEFGVEVIGGVEISTEIEGGACHILGYFMDVADRALGDVLEAARGGRDTRNAKILARLNELGFPLTAQEMAARVGDGVLTRAHFAAAMLEKGYVKNWDEAFDRYLGHGKPAYVHRARVTAAEAIRVLHGA
ncbi:MAG: PHP domain-containing protein, partial [Planctomycetota bacterium]|nr:PHP domain-containing protein [Planctomycetota bacterium]